MIGGIRSPACAQANEDTTYVLIDAEAFRALLHGDHGFCLKLLAGMAHRMHAMVNLLEDIVLRDATSRVANHLLELSDRVTGKVRLAVSRKDLASHLNLTPETLSRSLRRLQQHALITQADGQITIADREGMSDIATGPFPLI